MRAVIGKMLCGCLLALLCAGVRADYLRVESAGDIAFYLMVLEEYETTTIDFTTERAQATNFTIREVGQGPLGRLVFIKYGTLYLAVQGVQQLYLIPQKNGSGTAWNAPHEWSPAYDHLDNQGVVLIRERWG